MSKYILKVSTTGVDCTQERIYRLVLKEIGTNVCHDFWYPVETAKIASNPVLSDIDKGLALTKFDEIGVTFEETYPVVKDILENNEIVGFSVGFDIKFIMYECARFGKTIEIFNTKVIDLIEVEQQMMKFDILSVMERHFGSGIPMVLDVEPFDKSKRYDALYCATQFERLYNLLCVGTEREFGKRLLSESGILIEQNNTILFGAGKHQGERIGEVIKKDLPYVQWLFQNTDFFTRNSIAFIMRKLKERADKKSTVSQ